MDNLSVLYFLEDIAHEKLIRPLVTRIAHQVAGDLGISSLRIEEQVQNAAGGKGSTLKEFSRFLRENKERQAHILIVAIDANCDKYTSRLEEILRRVKEAEIRWQVICAVPDPHIERWYLSDPSAIPRAFHQENPVPISLPRYKCERDWYKHALRKAIESTAGISPPLGGAEYGQEIAEAMDLYTAGKEDRALKHFVDNLKQVFFSLLRPFAEGKRE